MGLGKTAEVVALMLANAKDGHTAPMEQPQDPDDVMDVEGWALPGAPQLIQDCTGPQMLCYCGGTVNGPGIRCEECQQIEHVECANYCPAEEAHAAGTFPAHCPRFVCATCLSRREDKIATRATLIIVPDTNVSQWCQEVKKLVSD
jgi:SNF2 family DNA or RNA helicase